MQLTVCKQLHYAHLRHTVFYGCRTRALVGADIATAARCGILLTKIFEQNLAAALLVPGGIGNDGIESVTEYCPALVIHSTFKTQLASKDTITCKGYYRALLRWSILHQALAVERHQNLVHAVTRQLGNARQVALVNEHEVIE